jgi:hypothetical protein
VSDMYIVVVGVHLHHKQERWLFITRTFMIAE